MCEFTSGTVIQEISLNKNSSNNYYILSGDFYGLFAINNFGQLYLTSPLLNQTVNEYFQLVILISSSPLSYCQTNISVLRTPKWSYFVCPAVSYLYFFFLLSKTTIRCSLDTDSMDDQRRISNRNDHWYS